MIKHYPNIKDTDKVCDLYSKKDGVPIKYVCTTDLNGETFSVDVYYRETPHPEFGNRYFGLYYDTFTRFTKEPMLMIKSADKVEDLVFDMIEGPNGFEYSAHRHDFHTVGSIAIDGGRSYTRIVGPPHPIVRFRVKDGNFVKVKS